MIASGRGVCAAHPTGIFRTACRHGFFSNRARRDAQLPYPHESLASVSQWHPELRPGPSPSRSLSDDHRNHGRGVSGGRYLSTITRGRSMKCPQMSSQHPVKQGHEVFRMFFYPSRFNSEESPLEGVDRWEFETSIRKAKPKRDRPFYKKSALPAYAKIATGSGFVPLGHLAFF